MKFAIDYQQRDFFHKNRFLSLEGLLKDTQVQALNAGIDLALEKKLGGPIRKFNSDAIYKAGYDLWRENEDVRRVVTSVKFAELVYDLLQTKPIRLGNDQLFPSVHQSSIKQNHFIDQLQTNCLEATNCIQGLLCGLIICLSDGPTSTIFPGKAGDAVLIHPSLHIDFTELRQHEGQRFLMITYGQSLCQYLLNEKDLQTHVMKNYGYVFGDKLKDNLHPILLRS